MGNLCADTEQPSLDALAERIDTARFFCPEAGELCLPRCTALKGQVCPLNDCLTICNELLFDIGLELREQRGGSLSLVSFQPSEANLMSLRNTESARANNLLRRLLRNHVCIASLELTLERVELYCAIVSEELSENCRLRKFKVQFDNPYSGQNHITALLPRLHALEELSIYMSSCTDVFVDAVAELLRTTTCLTSLVFQACYENGQPPKTFIDALVANSTLKTLELWANWITVEPPGCLGEYVMSNRLITDLSIFGDSMDREELLLEEALVRNGTLSTLYVNVCGGERTTRFLTRILAECTALRKLSIGLVRYPSVNISEATLMRFVEAVVENRVLEELKVPYPLWHPNNWTTFFAFLPRNNHLRKLEVSHHSPTDYETFPPVLQVLERTMSSGRVSFGRYKHTAAVDLMRFEAFSGIEIYGEVRAKVAALQRLPASDHFTCLSVGLAGADERLLSSLARYIRASRVLRDLRLVVADPSNTARSSYWTDLFESISTSTSISDLLISSVDNLAYNERLASTIRLSRYITRVYCAHRRGDWNPVDFVLTLSEDIARNYNLLQVQLTGAKLGAEARRSWFAIKETIRRNSGLVERAAAFNQTARLDWYTANALETVSRCPALLREVAEKEGAHELASMIRSRLRSVEGLHDFMRLTGVVKEYVTCAPPVGGSTVQLHDLNAECWRQVRRYLCFDDVKRFQKPDNSMHL